ncbi:MAG: hypothetical protein V7646_4042, partial [Pseudonocardia sp.]
SERTVGRPRTNHESVLRHRNTLTYRVWWIDDVSLHLIGPGDALPQIGQDLRPLGQLIKGHPGILDATVEAPIGSALNPWAAVATALARTATWERSASSRTAVRNCISALS